MKKKKILIGTRKSPLAIAQASIISSAISQAHYVQTELIYFKTKGDKKDLQSESTIGIKGLFTFELERALSNCEIDLAVHSLKDMPADVSEELPIVALSKREDPRDALVLPLNSVNKNMPLGTSSLRRKIQLEKLMPDREIAPIRGNINTRLKKLDEGNFSGLILAASGLLRLGLQNRIAGFFSPEELTPAPGQGILACQGRAGEDYSYLDTVMDEASDYCARAERSFAKITGAGCSKPVGAYAHVQGSILTLHGLYVRENSDEFNRGMISGHVSEAEQIGQRLAEQVMKYR